MEALPPSLKMAPAEEAGSLASDGCIEAGVESGSATVPLRGDGSREAGPGRVASGEGEGACTAA